MVHFTLYGPAALFCSCARCTPLGMRVTPFGHPRINGHVHLPAASRSLSRPSSPGGSTGIRRGPMLAWPYLPSRPLSRGSQGHAKYHILHSRPGPQSSPPSFLPFSCPVKDLFVLYMGRDRVELSTPALSERCSNQLSYHPGSISPERKDNVRTRTHAVHSAYLFPFP